MTLSQALQQTIERLNISDVVVKTIATTLGDDVVPGVNLGVNDSSSVQIMSPTCQNVATFNADDASERLVVFEVKAGVRLFRGAAKEVAASDAEVAPPIPLATIEASFFASYSEKMKDGAFVGEDGLVQFAIANVPMNVWPYWRELVQSACSRMALPRIVLPAHRLKKRELQTPSPEMLSLVKHKAQA